MTPTVQSNSATPDLDAIAWGFLGSEFAGPRYLNWPIDRRLDAYLQHHGLAATANDGSAHAAVLKRVMANLSRAVRNGVIATTTS